MENAFVYLGQYRRAARRAGRSPEEIEKVLADATSGDYEHLCEVIAIANDELKENV